MDGCSHRGDVVGEGEGGVGGCGGQWDALAGEVMGGVGEEGGDGGPGGDVVPCTRDED